MLALQWAVYCLRLPAQTHSWVAWHPGGGAWRRAVGRHWRLNCGRKAAGGTPPSWQAWGVPTGVSSIRCKQHRWKYFLGSALPRDNIWGKLWICQWLFEVHGMKSGSILRHRLASTHTGTVLHCCYRTTRAQLYNRVLLSNLARKKCAATTKLNIYICTCFWHQLINSSGLRL